MGRYEVGQRIFPDELELLLVRHEEGFVIRAEEARRVRDNVDAFRGNVREEI